MKRHNNLYQRIYDMDNLIRAEKRARKGKLSQPGVIEFDKDREGKLKALQGMLVSQTYKTSPYIIFKVFEPKEREVYRLPYFPDRIAQHAAMMVLEKYFVSVFTADSFSCIKKKGIHAASFAVREALKDRNATQYCLKLDIKKFYPNIDHHILKQLLRRKFKDPGLLWFLDEIIDSAPGLPIGNYLSQYFANFYLTYFDHWIKENKAVKHYFRYADDIVILSSNKPYLHQILAEIRIYLEKELKLSIKQNYQIFPVASRGIDFVGYVCFHGYTKLRKGIKKNFARMLHRNKNKASIASYAGWAKHCNSKNLIKTLLNDAQKL